MAASRPYLAGEDAVVIVSGVSAAVFGLVGNVLSQVVRAVPTARAETHTHTHTHTHTGGLLEHSVYHTDNYVESHTYIHTLTSYFVTHLHTYEWTHTIKCTKCCFVKFRPISVYMTMKDTATL